MFSAENFLHIVQDFGYISIVLLMFLESSFFPFPSEVVVTPAAYLAYKGVLNVELVVLCGIIGSLLGAIFNYYFALYLGKPFLEKYGKYFFISKSSLDKVELFFKKHGSISTFVGRLIPGIRQYISLPAGLAKMNIALFSLFTALGAGIWICILAFVGYTFGYKEEFIKTKLNYILIYLGIFLVLTIIIYSFYKIKLSKK